MKILRCSDQCMIKVQVHKKELFDRYDIVVPEDGLLSLNPEEVQEMVTPILDDLCDNENLTIHVSHIPTHVTMVGDVLTLACYGITVKDEAFINDSDVEDTADESSNKVMLCFHNVFEASEFVKTSGLIGNKNKVENTLFRYNSHIYLYLSGGTLNEDTVIKLKSAAYTVSGIEQKCGNTAIIIEHGESMSNVLEKLSII